MSSIKATKALNVFHKDMAISEHLVKTPTIELMKWLTYAIELNKFAMK
jgi:hypothetical protein